jgi:hypothetical protein
MTPHASIFNYDPGTEGLQLGPWLVRVKARKEYGDYTARL